MNDDSINTVLVLNCGSSSVKFAVIAADDCTQTLLSGLAERLGSPEATITFKQHGKQHNGQHAEQHDGQHRGQTEKTQIAVANADHDKALLSIVRELENSNHYHITAVGHRVVHGGEYFSESCLVDDTVLAHLTDCNALAPLHNPANIAGIRAAQHAHSDLPQVVVFDTAFHQTLPETAYLYALPYAYYQDYGVRRYGFHGTSFRFINQAIPDYNQGKPVEKVIVAHLGNGASVCAIKDGQSVATSMGLTPLDGLVQGTRSGSIDPAIVAFLAEQTQKSADTITDELWKQSGLLGISQHTNDCRELEEKAQNGDKDCARALSVFIARLQEVIGSYAAVMNGVDALVFTGGIGENSAFIREQTLACFGYLGFAADLARNAHCVCGEDGNIATDDSKPIWVIPTDEERMIAEDVLRLTR